MKKIPDVRNLLQNLLETRPVMIALALLCALLIWFAVSVTAYKTTHVKFYNIPVSLDLTGTAAESYGLSVVSCDVESVTVELEGNRSQIGRLAAEDLTATIEVDNVTTAGEFTFAISVADSKDISFTASTITPARATVELDKIESRAYTITKISYPNITITDGHALDETGIVCEPAVIEIEGPSAQLDQIYSVEVYTDKSASLDSSYSFYTSEVKLYTIDKIQIENENLNIPSTNFQITLPVLTQKALALTYEIRNAPSNFDLDWLKERLYLSEETITLASQTSTVFAEREEWSMGFVKLDDIDLNFTAEFEIDTGEDFTNQSSFNYVQLSLDAEGLTEKSFSVSGENVSVINAPKDYDITVITQNVTVTVIGTEEELEKLSTQDIIITADLLNYDISQSMSFSPDVAISFYSNSDEKTRFWAVGSYVVALNAQQKEQSTETTTSAATQNTENV